MRRGWWACALGVRFCACGGSEFAETAGSADDAATAVDAVDDAHANEASDVASDDAVTAPPSADAHADVPQSGDDAGVEASPAICTVLTPSRHACPSNISQAVPPYDVPAGFDYLMWNPLGTDGGGYTGCSVSVTPFACQCAETYTCACLVAHLDAPTLCQQAGAVLSCEQSDGAPLVRCPGIDAGF